MLPQMRGKKFMQQKLQLTGRYKQTSTVSNLVALLHYLLTALSNHT